MSSSPTTCFIFSCLLSSSPGGPNKKAPGSRGPCQREHSTSAPYSLRPQTQPDRRWSPASLSLTLVGRLWGWILGGPGRTSPPCCSRCPWRAGEGLAESSLMTWPRCPARGSTFSPPCGWERGRRQRARERRRRRLKRKSGPSSATSETKVRGFEAERYAKIVLVIAWAGSCQQLHSTMRITIHIDIDMNIDHVPHRG